MPTLKKFEDLDVWKDARELAKEIYLLTQQESFKNDIQLIDQIREIAIRIPNFIAKGVESNNHDEFIKSLESAKIACTELYTLFAIIVEIKAIDSDEKIKFETLIDNLLLKISSLINYLQPNQHNQHKPD